MFEGMLVTIRKEIATQLERSLSQSIEEYFATRDLAKPETAETIMAMVETALQKLDRPREARKPAVKRQTSQTQILLITRVFDFEN